MANKDADCVLATAQAVTASAGTTDFFVNGTPGFNALTDQMQMEFRCVTTCDSANDTATLIGSVQVCPNDDFSNHAVTIGSSGSFVIGSEQLTAGGLFHVPIGWNPDLDNNHMRGYFTVGTQNLSAGAFDVEIVKNPQRNY